MHKHTFTYTLNTTQYTFYILNIPLLYATHTCVHTHIHIYPRHTCMLDSSYIHRYRKITSPAHTHTLVIPPNRGRYDTYTVYTIRILHAIGDGTLWCTTCNRGRFVYETDSSLITGTLRVHTNFRHLWTYSTFDLQLIALTLRGGDHPRIQNVPSLIVECHTYVPGWRRLQTHTHIYIHTAY